MKYDEDPTYSISIETERGEVQLMNDDLTSWMETSPRSYRLVFKHNGEPVLTFHGSRFDVSTPGLSALAEMVERANASVEGRPAVIAP